MKQKSLIIILFLFIILGCSNEPETSKSTTQYNWEESSPTELNIDQDLLNNAFAAVQNLKYIYGILVIRNGKLAAERYYNGHNKNSENNIRSVSKSFLSATTGIAIEKGLLEQNDKLTKILAHYNLQTVDARFHDITIDHLLKMKSGLDSDNNIYMTVFTSPNWLETIFGMRLVNDPGEKFVYTTSATHLLSAALTTASEQSSYDFVTENLLTPLGIELDYWEQDPNGIYFGGNNMYFTTRNMAVLGLLYLNNGLLDNKQIIQKEWIEKSLTDHTAGNLNWGVMSNIGYGHLWWLGKLNGYKIFSAIGHGGQFVLCVPELDLIVATNAYSNIGFEQADIQERKILEIISKYIIPSITPY